MNARPLLAGALILAAAACTAPQKPAPPSPAPVPAERSTIPKPPERSKAATVPACRKLTVAAVGDVMLGTDFPEDRLPQEDGRAELTGVAADLAAADITFGNLEGVLMDGGEPVKQCQDPKVCFLFRSPTRYAQTLKGAGFDVMSLANNHARDFGETGRSSTMAALDTAGIRHSGRIGDVAEWEQDGRRIALIAFSFTSGSHPLNDTEGARALVTELAAANDLVIVSFHGGAEGGDATHVPFAMEHFFGEDRGNVVEFGRAMVDAGADLVLGAGPHVARAIEVWHERLIAYSLGNFATYFGISVEGMKGYAPILKATVDTEGKLLEGRIVSALQIRPDGVRPDPQQRAFHLVRDMTQEDLAGGGLVFDESGGVPAGAAAGGKLRNRGRAMSGNALQAAYPALADALPCISFTELPTPLDDAPALAKHLQIGSLSIKRDDLTSPLYGGNKVRKLEYLLADALARGCDTVVTFGATGSNHALATAVFARRLGLACHAVLTHQSMTPYIAATLRYHLHLGTVLHAAKSYNHSREVLEEIRRAHPQGPARVCEIPWGGSNWLGAAGFVAAALEIAAQFEANGSPPPDFIYLAAGSMGTVIGLSLGLAIAGLDTRIVAPRVVPFGATAAERVKELVAEANHKLHALDAGFPLVSDPGGNVEIRHEFLGTGYAEATAEALEAVALMQELQHLKLETTYTGKAFAGVVADGRAGRLAGKRVVFWDTYNSAPYPPGLKDIDLSALPAEFRGYLAQARP